MKKIFLTLIAVIASYCSYAQTTNTFPTTGSAGIWTLSPRSNLEVSTGANAGATIITSNNGSPGSSTTPVYLRNDFAGYNYTGYGPNARIEVRERSSSYTGSDMSFQVRNGWALTPIMFLDGLTTNVGIGTTTPVQPLTIQNDAADLRLQSTTSPTGYYTDLVNNYSGTYPFYINVNQIGRLGFKSLGLASPDHPAAFISGYYGIGFATSSTDPTSANLKMVILQNGNVGIGTTSPTSLLSIGSSSLRGTVGIIGSTTQAPVITLVDSQTGGRGYSIYSGLSAPGNFDILDQAAGAYRFTIIPSGNVGIGNLLNPAGLLSLNNQIAIGSDPINYTATSSPGQTVFNSYYAVNTDGYGPYPRYLDIASVGSPDGTNGGGNIRFLTNPFTASSQAIERMRIASNGNVIIGAPFIPTNSAYLLNVSGFVRANEVVVNTTGADFVFDSSYRLNSLSDLKKYIDQNHHLPEIASAKQMQAEGIKVGENETKLLQKVEELTLYLIESDKKEKEQQTQMNEQNQKILDQEQRIKLLETKLDQLLKK